MSGFSNPIAAGDGTLLVDAIKSPNYVLGASGWSINADGTAEFNDVTARGRVEVGPSNGPQVVIKTQVGPPAGGFLAFPTHAVSELSEAHMQSFVFNQGLPNEAGSLAIRGPQSVGAQDRLSLTLNAQNNDGSSTANYLLNIAGGQTIVFGDKNDFNLRLNNNFVVRNPAAGPINQCSFNAALVDIVNGPLRFGGTTFTRYQRGKATLNFAAVAVVSQTVTFPVGFSSSPNVNVTIETGNNAIDYCVKIRQLSTASFNVQVRERTNTAVTDTVIVHWRAEN